MKLPYHSPPMVRSASYSGTPVRYTTEAMPKYILPSTDWAPLLPTIAKDAQPGAIIETYTAAMYDLMLQELSALGRTDIEVYLLSREPPKRPTPGEHA